LVVFADVACPQQTAKNSAQMAEIGLSNGGRDHLRFGSPANSASDNPLQNSELPWRNVSHLRIRLQS
jgi:hypothetical protein